MKKSEFDNMLKVALNTYKPPIPRKGKTTIRIYTRLNGLIRFCFLTRGKMPIGYEAATTQSKNKKHARWILINPKKLTTISTLTTEAK